MKFSVFIICVLPYQKVDFILNPVEEYIKGVRP